AELALPPPQIFDRIGVDGLVDASVRLPVSPIVALEIHTSGSNPTNDGRLPDGAPNLAAVELEGTRPPDVDGEHSSLGTRHFPFLPAAGRPRGSCISYPDRTPEAITVPGVGFERVDHSHRQHHPELGLAAHHAGVGLARLRQREFLDHGPDAREHREAQRVLRIGWGAGRPALNALSPEDQ